MMETVFVCLLVAAAVVLLARGLFRNVKAGKTMCGCGSVEGGCQLASSCGRAGVKKADAHE